MSYLCVKEIIKDGMGFIPLFTNHLNIQNMRKQIKAIV